MAIKKIEGGYVIASHQVALPGVYDSQRAARYAFRFRDEDLQALQDSVNGANPDYSKRVITFEMLQERARALRQEGDRR